MTKAAEHRGLPDERFDLVQARTGVSTMARMILLKSWKRLSAIKAVSQRSPFSGRKRSDHGQIIAEADTEGVRATRVPAAGRIPCL
jgi:hypothetical protein